MEKLNPNITTAEWNKIFNKSLTTYKAAIWQLIALIELGSSKFGRDRIVELTPFDEKRINYYNKLGRLPIKACDLLPEVAFELTYLKDTKQQAVLYKNVKDKNLKAKELRKQIRKSQSNSVSTKPSMPMPQWPKHLTLLIQDINKLEPRAREQAKVILQQSSLPRLMSEGQGPQTE